ncbi:hypothetical protein [Mycoplasmopsis cynos]|uniref:hypothetical protein n=1 Tax=Mycoplasmopsis cynos TaxID=171284 RepID=UPI0030CEE5A7
MIRNILKKNFIIGLNLVLSTSLGIVSCSNNLKHKQKQETGNEINHNQVDKIPNEEIQRHSDEIKLVNQYRVIKNKILEFSNLLILDKYRREVEQISQNSEFEKYSKTNYDFLNSKLKEIEKQYNLEQSSLINGIKKLKSTVLRSKLENNLKNVTNWQRRLEMQEKIKKYEVIEKGRNISLDKIETQKWIDKVKDSNERNVLMTQFNSANDIDKIDTIKDKIEQELLKSSKKEYILFKIEILKSKIDSDKNLKETEKDKLKNQLKNTKDISKINKIEFDINEAISSQNVKIKLGNLLNLLKNGEELKNSFTYVYNKVKNPIDVLEAINTIENFLNNLKSNAEKAIFLLDEKDAKKEELNKKLMNAKTQNDYENIFIDAQNFYKFVWVLETDEVMEINKKELLELSNSISDINTKNKFNSQVNAIKNSKELFKIKQNIILKLKNENESKFLMYIQNTLNNKIKNSDLFSSKKNELFGKVHRATKAEIDEVEKRVNQEIYLNILQQKVIQAIYKSNNKSRSKLEQKEVINLKPFELIDIINNVEKNINDKNKKIRDEILKLKDESIKAELLDELSKSKTESDIDLIEVQMQLLNGEYEKIKAFETINKLSNFNFERFMLLNTLNDPKSTKEMLINATNKANEIIRNVQHNAINEVEKIRGLDDYDSLIIEANDLSVSEDQLNDIISVASGLYDDEKSKILTNWHQKAKAREGAMDLMKQIKSDKNIIELRLIDRKINGLELINKLNDSKKVKEFTKHLIDISTSSIDALEQIEKVINDAIIFSASTKNNEIERIIAKTNTLPYPDGQNAPAIKEILARILKIQKENLNESDKLTKIREIANKYDNLIKMINERKIMINYVSPKRRKYLNILLNKASFLSNNSDEFEKFDKAFKTSIKSDKNEAKTKINLLSFISKKAKNDAISKIDLDTTDSYDKVKKILDFANISDYKIFLINKANNLDFPDDASAKTIKDIITKINSNELNSLNQFKEIEVKLDEIAINIIKSKISLAKLKSKM